MWPDVWQSGPHRPPCAFWRAVCVSRRGSFGQQVHLPWPRYIKIWLAPRGVIRAVLDAAMQKMYRQRDAVYLLWRNGLLRVDFSDREYQVKKAGARPALFGHDASMAAQKRDNRGMIDVVGPWGALRRR